MIIKRNQKEFSKKRGNGITQADIDKALAERARKDAAKGKPAVTSPQPSSPSNNTQVVQNPQPKIDKPNVQQIVEKPKTTNLPAVTEKPKTTNLPAVTEKPKSTNVPTTAVNKSVEKVSGKSKGFLGKLTKGQKIAGAATLGAAAVGTGIYAYKKHKDKQS